MAVSLSRRNAIGIALSKTTFLLLICWSLTPKLYWSISSKYAAGLMIVSFIGILLSTNVSVKDMMRYAVSYLAAILLTLYVWYFVRRSYYNPFLYVANGIVVWYPVVFSRHLIQMKDDRFNKVVLTTVVLCLLITGITTIIGQLEYPMASRLLAGGGDINDLEFFSKMNIGGYSYIYAAVLSIPYLIFLISPQQRKKNIALSILSFLTLIVIVGAIYLSQYYIALVLMLAVLLVTFIALAFASKLKRIEPFLSVRKRGLSVVIIGCLLLISLVGSISFTSLEPVQNVMRSSGQMILIERAENISDSTAGHQSLYFSSKSDSRADESDQDDFDMSEGPLSARINVYMRPIEGFLRSPWFGNAFAWQVQPSGHSEILDAFFSGGILGSIIFLVLILLIYSGLYRGVYKSILLYPFFLISFITFIGLGMINTLSHGKEIILVASLVPVLFASSKKS